MNTQFFKKRLVLINHHQAIVKFTVEKEDENAYDRESIYKDKTKNKNAKVITYKDAVITLREKLKNIRKKLKKNNPSTKN